MDARGQWINRDRQTTVIALICLLRTAAVVTFVGESSSAERSASLKCLKILMKSAKKSCYANTGIGFMSFTFSTVDHFSDSHGYIFSMIIARRLVNKDAP
jgi:hypothetical protein